MHTVHMTMTSRGSADVSWARVVEVCRSHSHSFAALAGVVAPTTAQGLPAAPQAPVVPVAAPIMAKAPATSAVCNVVVSQPDHVLNVRFSLIPYVNIRDQRSDSTPKPVVAIWVYIYLCGWHMHHSRVAAMEYHCCVVDWQCSARALTFKVDTPCKLCSDLKLMAKKGEPMAKIMSECHSFEECYTSPLSMQFKLDTYQR